MIAGTLRSPEAPSRLVAYVRAMPPVWRASIVAALVCATVGVAAQQGNWLRSTRGVASTEHEPVARLTAPVTDAAKAQARRRCDTCGVVESIRRVEPVGDAPGSYEFTVRLRDGSARTSHDANASRWRTGDRVMLIGGNATTD